MIHRSSLSARDRRAMILMVVLALLTLFTIVGITFVYISDSYATSARLAREAENLTNNSTIDVDIDPNLPAAFVLSQLLYDVNDDTNGVQSSLRGWSLGRNMYGWNSNALNDKAYAGLGRLSLTGPTFSDKSSTSTWNMVNYQYFSSDGFVIDPERIGQRANPGAAANPYVAGNVPYTYPDQNNMFLAHLDAAQNTVAIPSFHRNWLVNLGGYPGNPFKVAVDSNWTSAAGKYMMLRPRPTEHPQFPYPDDQFGDVKNLDNSPGGNDSVWIDPGGPVLTAPNGTQYKVLVAPLILPLDGRINVNAAGNILAGNNTATPTQAGNQGFGPYEVSLMQVMTKDAAFPNNTEWINLFLGINPQINPNNPTGNSQVQGRYGPSGRPQQPASGASNPSGGAIPRAWARIDMNGLVDPVMLFPPQNPGTTFTATSQYGLPGSYDPTPIFPGDGYNDGYPRELSLKGLTPGKGDPTIHPLLFNPIIPGPGNRIFSPNDMATFLLSGYKNSNGNPVNGAPGGYPPRSDLLQLCPINFADIKTRNLLTALSFDLDRPAPVPYVWDRTAAPSPYVLNTTTYPYTVSQPTPQSSPFNNVSGNRSMMAPATGEFDPNTWRSTMTMLNKVNVNRPLTNYPTVDPTSGMMATDKTTLATFAQAQNDRTTLARDIFNVLQMATGARNYLTDPPLVQTNYTTAGQWAALRYLAQVSVNLVDFIDSDDIITAFTWSTDPTDNMVYGVELPRLVINETYVQMNNDPNDPHTNNKATLPYQFNVWTELLNPLNAKNDPAYKSFGTTKDPEAWLLTVGANSYPIYQLKIAQGNISSTFQDPANVMGDPDFNLNGSPSRVFQTVTDFGAQGRVLPINGAYSTTPPKTPNANPLAPSTGFYVIGPSSMYLAGDDPKLTVTQQTANMMYTQPLTNPNLTAPTVVLQRLLCPGLPPQTSMSGMTPYNPYITTDYVEQTCPTVNNVTNANDMRQYLRTGRNPAYPSTKAPYYSAMQRWQPYAAAKSLWNPLTPSSPSATSAQNTFYAHNASSPPAQPGDTSLQLPFDWLVHLDRQPISKTELIYAATCKPHELTQLFQSVGYPQSGPANGQNVDSTGQSVWLNPNTLLYRFFEFATITPRVTGFTAGCRSAGRININLAFNQEIMNAICDPQPGNAYTNGTNYNNNNVSTVFANMVNGRQPGINPPYQAGNSVPYPAQSDTPYWGFGVGPAPGGDQLSVGARGLNGQFFTPYSVAAQPNMNPYQRFEMLNKITNNVTTRSNVFAIWMTFGLFQVTNSSTTPPTLGPELLNSQLGHIRHRAFAIVDRTNVQVFQTTSTAAITPQSSTATGIPVTTLSLAKMNGTVAQSNFKWQVQTGSVLTYDPNTNNEETVVVVPDANGNPGAVFYGSHAANCTVISRGNPGPVSTTPYNPLTDSNVVLYYAIIN